MFQDNNIKFLLEMFLNDSSFVEVKNGETLFRQGDPGEDMYVLVQGAAAVTIDGVLFEVLSPGAFVGEMSLLDGSPRFGTVTARANCRFAKVDKKRFRTLVQEMPDFSFEVMRLLVKRLKQCDMRVVIAALRQQGQTV